MDKLLTLAVLILGIASLFLEQLGVPSFLPGYTTSVIDYLIVALSVIDLIIELKKAPYPWIYIKRNLLSVLFLVLFLVFFFINKYLQYSEKAFAGNLAFTGITGLIVFRNFFMLLKIFTRFRKLNVFLQNIAVHPAHTLVLSFLLVIIAGSLLLVMPFASAKGETVLSFIDALFTATSAVCVTGLAVADTAVQFSLWGKIVLLILIQIGGLGIMLLSFSTMFMFRRRVSLENRMLVSYMINEDDMTKLSGTVKRIVYSTFLIEGIGAFVLFWTLPAGNGAIGMRIFNALFHSISAFCNAGFSLYSDSLESAGNVLSLLSVSALIILGGLSFSSLFDIRRYLSERMHHQRRKTGRIESLRINTRVVLRYTGILIVTGTFVIYFFEHGNTMESVPVAHQYVHAFFQSVTLRTAGFNSISFAHLSRPVLLVMIAFMFIGGASGSTAGGIKINTFAVIIAYVQAFRQRKKVATIYRSEIARDTVIHAFLIFFFGISLVIAGSLLLTITEKADFLPLLFETVSAFATVGLSTGLTTTLSAAGKIVIMVLMFFGRLGPLTIVAAAGTERSASVAIRYPEAEISIG